MEDPSMQRQDQPRLSPVMNLTRSLRAFTARAHANLQKPGTTLYKFNFPALSVRKTADAMQTYVHELPAVVPQPQLFLTRW